MHLYVITRGIKDQVDNLINDLQAQYFPYKMNNEEFVVQLAVRPIQLWELVLPEQSLPELQKFLWGVNSAMVDPAFKGRLSMVRRLLGAKKIPNFDEKLKMTSIRLNRSPNVGVYGVGIKPDNYNVKDKRELL